MLVRIAHFFAAASCLFAFVTTYADSLTILGTTFKVDAIDDLDSSHTKITNFGASKIVDKDQVKDAIVEQYSSRPELFSLIPFAESLSFIKNGLMEERRAWAEKFFVKALTSPVLKDDQVIQIISELRESKQSDQFFLNALSVLNSMQPAPPLLHVSALCRLAFFAARLDFERVKELSSSWIYSEQNRCGEQLQQLFFSMVITKQLLESRELLSTFGSLYGVQDPIFRRLSALASRIERLVQAIDAGDSDGASRALKSQGSEAEDEVVLTLGSGLAEERGRALANSGDTLSALKLITLIDFKRRTPRLHEFVEDILARSDSITPLVFEGSPVLTALRSFSLKDDGIRRNYLTLLDRSFLEALRNMEFQKARALFDQILILRNDPHKANDAARIAWAIALVERGGAIEEARTIIDEVQTGVPLTSRITLFTSGMYVNVKLFIWMVLISLLCPLFDSGSSCLSCALQIQTLSGSSSSRESLSADGSEHGRRRT